LRFGGARLPADGGRVLRAGRFNGGTSLALRPGARRRALGWLFVSATGLALILATAALLRARDGREDLRDMRACGFRFLERIRRVR